MRESPGTASTALAALPSGTDLDLTGDATTSEGIRWWPVRVEQDGETVAGYVWADGIAPDDSPGLVEGVRELVRRLS